MLFWEGSTHGKNKTIYRGDSTYTVFWKNRRAVEDQGSTYSKLLQPHIKAHREQSGSLPKAGAMSMGV